VVNEAPRVLAERMAADFDSRGSSDQAVILCPDAAWSLALMKFTMDEAARSFPANVRDFERRGMFEEDRGEGGRRRREIEALFRDARQDKAALIGARGRGERCRHAPRPSARNRSAPPGQRRAAAVRESSCREADQVC